MISFSTGGWRFHLRAAAIVLHGDAVLLHRLADDPFWALPGGRVEIGETAEAAVKREMQEELGVDVQVQRLLAVVENLFSYRGQPQHGLEMHFLVALPPDSPLLNCAPFERVEEGGVGLDGHATSHARLHFRWFPLGEIGSIDLRPAFLSDFLASGIAAGTTHTAHIVHDDRR